MSLHMYKQTRVITTNIAIKGYTFKNFMKKIQESVNILEKN